MNRELVAKELLAVVRDLTADFADVNAYHNVYDYFEPDGRRFSIGEVREVQEILEDAVLSTKREREAIVRKALRSRRRELEERGIRVK